jgi:hypothetical protein
MSDVPGEKVMFEHGDVVECVTSYCRAVHPLSGERYVVDCVVVTEDGQQAYVHLMEDPRLASDRRGGWYPSRFRLVRRAADTRPEVHCGGPYVARSVHDKLVDDLTETVIRLTAERDSARQELENQTSKVPEPLKKPDPPSWLRVGWWYAMDDDGSWHAYKERPQISEGGGDWTGGVVSRSIESWHMRGREVPLQRWWEACWQVTE